MARGNDNLTRYDGGSTDDMNDLFSAPFAQFDLAFLAHRDIAKGEEITLDYGVAWEQDWFHYATAVNGYLKDSDIRPLLHRNIEAPEGLFPDSWLDTTENDFEPSFV